MHNMLAGHPRHIQAKAFLLLAVFLAAGTSLPSLDAVVYHHQGADPASWQAHVEPAGGCLDHSEHCSLGRTAPGSGAAAALAGEVRVEHARRPASQLLPTQPHARAEYGILPQPRAPPALRDV